MTDPAKGPAISGHADLFAIAYRIEIDAVERYRLLADQMEVHNNLELVDTFRDLARAEGLHAEEIRRLAGDIDVAAQSRRIGGWTSEQSPEEADLSAVHYMMTPWHALRMALAGEQRALAFFERIVASTEDARIKALAQEFVAEETEHVALVHRLLRRHPPPPATWADDPDPPVSQE